MLLCWKAPAGWNKAVFAWTLGGLVLAVLLVYPAVVRAVLADRRRWIRAGLAFAVGIFPLLIYNVKHPNTTLGDNAHFSWEHFPAKYRELTGALNGSGLQIYLVAASAKPNRKAPHVRRPRAINRHPETTSKCCKATGP